MRALLMLGGVAALGLTALLPVAGAGSTYDSVTGAGWRGSPGNPTAAIRHFEVSAHNGPRGVSGQFSEDQAGNPGATFRGNVTCIAVTGNKAVIGGVVTSAADPANVGTAFAIGFIDNKSPAADTVTLTFVGDPLPADCTSQAVLFTLPLLPFSRGNVFVYDAP